MNGVWIPSVRAVTLFVVVIFGLLAFSAAKISTDNGVARGEGPEWAVAVDATPDTPGLSGPDPRQKAVAMRQGPVMDDREPGTWALMIFGLGAVAFALRRRRSDSVRCQFA